MDFGNARRNMIESQLRANRIIDEALLEVMAEVPRERFVPEALQGIAYVDEDLAIGGGRHFMEPLVLASLIQAAEVRPTDVVLDVASGAGYGAVVLARLAVTVFALESDATLAARAAELYAEFAPDNVVSIEGPLGEGCTEHAPFDVIVIEAGVERVPDAILNQLGDGGRLVAVIEENGVGRVMLIRKIGEHFSRRPIRDANIPLLEAFRRPPEFVF
ncbi:MAG: protein-L-isoaspartate O-methyltransferase [Rhodospirillales bacterium]|nr:MAG: protein-L-isoaspartate O-methyltransferase [Rhodospirillales bacterium]